MTQLTSIALDFIDQTKIQKGLRAWQSAAVQLETQNIRMKGKREALEADSQHTP